MAKQHTLRPYASAGVVLAGASLIAISPVAAPVSDIQTRAVRLTSTSAPPGEQPFPIYTPEELFTTTTNNLESLNTQIANDPSPILDQILINQAAFSNDIATAVSNASQDMTSEMQDLSTGLQNVMTDLASGDVYDAFYSDLYEVLLRDQLVVMQDLTTGLSQVSQGIADNVFNVVNDTAFYGDGVSGETPSWLTDLMNAPLYGPNAEMAGIAGVSQDIVTAADNGDYSTVLSDLANAPSTIMDAFLNGYGGEAEKVVPELMLAGLPSGEGLLGGQYDAGVGGIESILNAQREIAADLGGAPQRAFESLPLTDLFNGTTSGGLPDLTTLVSELSSALNPSTLLGDLTGLLDPSAATDIGAQLSTDLSSLFLSIF